MSKKIVINYCLQCKYCEHTGAFDKNRKYVCRHKDVYIRELQDKKSGKLNNVRYRHGQPIIGATENVDENTAIPVWCPLEDN